MEPSQPNLPMDPQPNRAEANPQSAEFHIDSFLLNALTNPRDRLTILKLDHDLEKFMKDGSRSRQEFPSTSSYQRLIVHRVADYYRLNHVATDSDTGKRSVVLFKTPDSRVPVIRFNDLIEEQPEISPPSAVRIMRRASSTTNRPHHGPSSQPSFAIQPSQNPAHQQPISPAVPHPQALYGGLPGSVDWRRSKSEDTLVSSIHHQYPEGNSSRGSGDRIDRSLEEREEEYAKVRARIFGSAPEIASVSPELERLTLNSTESNNSNNKEGDGISMASAQPTPSATKPQRTASWGSNPVQSSPAILNSMSSFSSNASTPSTNESWNNRL